MYILLKIKNIYKFILRRLRVIRISDRIYIGHIFKYVYLNNRVFEPHFREEKFDFIPVFKNSYFRLM